jgi:7-cyano-7-deazaguanine tRNA-ribosyltransferase
MIGDRDLKVVLCALDYPIFNPKLSSNEKDRCITQTIAYAYEMKTHFERMKPKSNIQAMAIIQGYDVDSLRFCAHELKSIGFCWYGLGSLLAVRQNVPVLLERVRTVIDEIGPNLHIFGISNISTVRKLKQLGVTSFDSARSAKSAMYNQIFFYTSNKLISIEIRGNSNIEIPIPPELLHYPCDCPICKGHINHAITIIGKRKNIALRAIHNYWHLKMAFLD